MIDPQQQTELEKLGLVNYNKLKELSKVRKAFLVDNMVLKPSINILAGDSGLGKSALAAQLGLCVASGKSFFGHNIDETGLVVYCDQEAQPATMEPMFDSLARHLGLPKVPDSFVCWNPGWNVNNKDVVVMHTKTQLYNIVNKVKPKLVIVDSLRNFYPQAINDQKDASVMIKEMRRCSAQTGCSWLLIHHLRKKNKEERANRTRPTVKRDVYLWLEEVAGSFALINNTDLRLGWEKDPAVSSDAMWLGGFLRVYGTIGPYKIVRVLDEEGDPIGYRLCDPSEQLNQTDYEIFSRLPDKGEFTFKYIRETLGMSHNVSSRFLHKAQDLGLVKFIREMKSNNNGGGRPRKVFKKVEGKY